MLFKIINAITDKITGFNIRKATMDAVKFDFLTREQISSYQQQKFQELSRIASTSNFYKDYGNKPLKEFPLVNRDEYHKNYRYMITEDNHSYQIKQSSGSTGLPVKQFITKDMLLAKRSSHQKMLHWYGLTRESPEIKLGGLQFGLLTRIYYLFRNKRYFDSYFISKNIYNKNKIVRTYNRLKPEILYGYPSTINEFLIHAHSNNIVLHPPKIIAVHAENLYNDIIHSFKSVFPDVKIVNQYWSTEANIAVTCPEGNLHVDENTVICEVINPDLSGLGDLYITNLFSYKVPIIRYKIGDRVKISNKPCSCGRNTKIIEKLEGRENEYLELPNGNKFPITAMQEIDFSDNILFYQLVYYKKDKKLIFKYMPVNSDLPILKEFIASFINDNLGLQTEFEQVSYIAHSPGGKLKRLIVFE